MSGVKTFIFFSLFGLCLRAQTNCESLPGQIEQIHKIQLGFQHSNGQSLQEIIRARKGLYQLYQESPTEKLKKSLGNHDSAMNDIMQLKEFSRLSTINKYLASLYLSDCSDEETGKDEENLSHLQATCIEEGQNFGSFPEIGEFGHGAMNAVSTYLLAQEKKEHFSLEKVTKDCEKLMAKDIKVDGCLTVLAAGFSQEAPTVKPGSSEIQGLGLKVKSPQKVKQTWCLGGEEYVQGKCLTKCGKLEFRANSGECVIDEVAQQARNERREKSKESWGRVWRTGAYAALIGGAALGVTWGVKEIFNLGKPQTVNEYTGDIHKYYYNTYNTTRENSNVNNYEYYYNYSQPSSSGYVPLLMRPEWENQNPYWNGFNPYMNYSYHPSYSNLFSN